MTQGRPLEMSSPTTEEGYSPQYQAVLQYKDELARSLASGPDLHLLNQFKIRGWLGGEVDTTPTRLIDEALHRIQSDPSDYEVFIGMLPENVKPIVDQITGMCPLSTPTAEVQGIRTADLISLLNLASTTEVHGIRTADLISLLSLDGVEDILPLLKTTGSYLREHGEELQALEEEEKALQRAILQAAAASGPDFSDILCQAIDLLTRVQQKLKQANPKWSANGVNFTDGRGKTKQFYSPLMHACEEGHEDRVKLLLDKGAKVDFIAGQLKPKPNGKSKIIGSRMNAVHVACVQGRTEVVQLLISSATNAARDILNAKTKDKWTPLMYSVKEGHTEVVKLLLEQDSVDILATNKKGQTALHLAGLHGRLECFKLIHANLAAEILQRADIENPYLSTDNKGYNVLHRVCKGPKGENDENVTVECLRWICESMPQLDKPELLNMKTQEGYSCLLLACDCNNRDLVEYLLREKRVDVNSTTQDGKTGLHIAALHDYPEIADLVMNAGISVATQDNEHKGGDSDEIVGMDTALHIAVRKSSASVEGLIRSRSDLPPDILIVQNKMGETPDEVKPEEIIPQEIRRLGDAAVNRYHQLLRRGKKKKMPRCNLIALGEQRVGKTSLLCLLTGEKFVKDRDPTRGIHNEKVDVLASVTVSSETWKEVKSEDIAKHNEKQFASSIAEDFRTDFAKDPTGGAHPPHPDELRGVIAAIEMHLQEIERAAEAFSEEPSTLVPRPKRAKRKSNDSFATAPKHPKHAAPLTDIDVRSENTPTEDGKAVVTDKRRSPSKPKLPTPVEKGSQPQPPSERSAEPVHGSPTNRASSLQRAPNIGRNLTKTIVSGAKSGSTATESVLRYNTLDFAGQSEYRAMHHCFIVRRAIYLVVFNLLILRDALKATTEVTQRALEEIRYWMNSIHAHIHKMGPEALRRVMLVGTHRCPKEGSTEHPQAPVTDEELREIDRTLEEMFTDTPVLNDIFRTGETWIATVENSLDGNQDREDSGAVTLQKAIADAWKELPFKDEAYPTTWLRFEAYLQKLVGTQIVNATIIKKVAKEEFGIGEENEEDIEMALGFFHDTGTIIYPPKLPTLYLKKEEKKVLDGLILLDPHWLTKMMRKVMELKAGRGPEMTNNKQIFLENTGCAELSLLKRCWSDLEEEDFHKLMLMLQSFCLVFPLPKRAEKDDTQTPCAQLKPDQQEEPEKSPSLPPLNQMYLIPSKLQSKTFDKELTKTFNLSFQFDFGGFLPEEVYHRLLCLVLKKLPKMSGKHKDIFTANFFKIYGVENCNWVVQMVSSKLCVWVKHEESSTPPSSYVNLVHMDYLQKICNENGSSLQGLKYIGGPVHICEEGDNQPEVVPCVSFPDDEEAAHSWKCTGCLKLFDIEELLNPKYVPKEKVPSTSTVCETVSEGTTFVRPPENATFSITASNVILPQPHSTLNLHIAEPNVPQLPEGVVSSQQAKGVLPDVTGKCHLPEPGGKVTTSQPPTATSDEPQLPVQCQQAESITVNRHLPEPRGKVTTSQPPTATSDGPTLPDLFRLKIHQRVGDRYQLFGVLLLNDKDGTKVASLDHQHKGKCEGIVMDILREWIQGNGVPSTWPELVQALNESDLNDLAKEVATRYSVN